MIDQEKIHKQCLSKNPKERIEALNQLIDNFSSISDKQQVWNDLIKLTNDKSSDVRYETAKALRSGFSHVPDKQQVWNDFIKLTNDKDRYVRYRAAYALDPVFSDVPDKQQVWNNLHKLTNDKSSDVRYKAFSALGSVFSHVPDKQKAWNDLIKLTNDQNLWVRSEAASTLRSVFSHVPDKQQAWNDLIKLITDQDLWMRSEAASALGSALSYVPYKQQAWNDLHKLTNDTSSDMRYETAKALRSGFSHVPDKQKAWNDLIKLTNDESSDVRYWAAYALVSASSYVPDKQKAWNDLIKLTNNEDSDVRYKAAYALASTFSDVPDKQQAWNDLHKLTDDKRSYVRFKVACALGSVFSDLPDKQQAWSDLHKLTNDKSSNVRTYANHSLGKFSIFKASQAEKEEEYKKELEKAIEFFEKAAHESLWDNPSQFCLPFYRSFHTIVFKKQEGAKEEVDKYLKEAKDTIKGSKSKELLFEAVENLANALKEVQNIENLDLEAKKGELNFYRQYCDRAAELMIETEETAPFATIAMRKGLPILDRNLKELLEEIHKKAKVACKESKGTATEELACAINREIQTWEIGSQEEMAFNVENLIFTLESNVPRIPENQYIFNRIQQIREQKDVPKQYGIISTIIPLIPKIYMEQKVDELENDIKEIKEKIDYVIISLKPGIKEEIEISVGTEILGTGVTHKVTIPLQEISYSELKEDLEKITGIKIEKLSKIPKRLGNKVKGYLLLHDKDDILDKLT